MSNKDETIVEDTQEEVSEEMPCDCEETVEKTAEELLMEENEALKKELEEEKNNYFKAYADAENMKKRLQNEADMIKKYRIQGFATELLPVLDSFERSISQELDDEKLAAYAKGYEMIYEQLKAILANEGVVEIEAKDKEFDPNFHNALMQEKVDGVESGMVVEELQKGYMLKDRVLRASLVKVSE